jgi:ribosomal protein S18 acetylase RimI-like enzyme
MPYSLQDVRALAPRTDLFIHQFRGSLKERDGYLVAETPGNPSYFWGNFLFFPHAPRAGDLERWRELFRREFAHEPLVRHNTFAWDEESPGNNAAFVAAGFKPEVGSALSLSAPGLKASAKKRADLEIRPLATDAEWEAATHNQIACRPDGWNIDAYTPFKREQMGHYRAMVANGHGHWWGAFLRGQLVAECGLFFSGAFGRFQAVGTAPAFRRQGICSSMVFEICRRAFAEGPSRTLVIVAEENEPADFIYRSVGFIPAGRQHSLMWWPREDWSS